MNVIFLDIDGVLNSKFWDESHQMEISDGKHIDTEKVILLSKLVNRTNASIVFHSGWRFWFDENIKPTRKESEHLVNLLAKEGMSISGVTPDFTTEEIRKTKKFSKVKADEILTWLHEHPETENWIVLDDLDLHNEEIARHQVMTDSEYGLTAYDVDKAFKMLNI